MLNIALCDDDPGALSHTKALLAEYLDGKGPYAISQFSGAMALLDAMRAKSFSLLLLDILMPGLTGMQAARELRRCDRETKIIFLTSSPEFAVESYRVEAFSYLLKPVHREELFPVLDKFFLQLRQTEKTVLLSTPDGLLRLPCGRIEVLEINSKKLLFCLTDGSQRQISGTLAEFEPTLLESGSFVKVHRSYLVNMDCIRQLGTGTLVTYSGRTVPISRLLVSGVRQTYLNYLFQKEGRA